jgi:hypothetical protein
MDFRFYGKTYPRWRRSCKLRANVFTAIKMNNNVNVSFGKPKLFNTSEVMYLKEISKHAYFKNHLCL